MASLMSGLKWRTNAEISAFLTRRHAIARQRVNDTREAVLRQEKLHADEEFRVHQDCRYGAARRRSAAKRLTSNGGVKIATSRARSSSRKTAAE